MENLPRMDKRGYRLVGTLINIYSGERLLLIVGVVFVLPMKYESGTQVVWFSAQFQESRICEVWSKPNANFRDDN